MEPANVQMSTGYTFSYFQSCSSKPAVTRGSFLIHFYLYCFLLYLAKPLPAETFQIYRSKSKLLALTLIDALRPKNPFSNKVPQLDKVLCPRRPPNCIPSDLSPHQPAAAWQFKKTVLKRTCKFDKKSWRN